MRINRLNSWTSTKENENLLFFSQRLDELLFHHSFDIYRYPISSIMSLCSEFIKVYHDVKDNIIAENNLHIIFSEFVDMLKSDEVAKNILTELYVRRLVNNYNSWNVRNKYENIIYIRRRLGGKNYYNGIVFLLKNSISKNVEKNKISKYSAILIRVLIDYGYNENYIFKCLHNTFFYDRVIGMDSYDKFINCFDFKTKKYTVYNGYEKDLSQLYPLINKMNLDDIDISLVDLKNPPSNIKTKKQKTILRFDNIKALDYYGAYSFTQTISSFVVNSYVFYRHIKNCIKEFGQVIDENNLIHKIENKDLLKYSVSAASHEDSSRNADNLLKKTFSSYRNMMMFQKITGIHNSAIYSENTSDSLLSLWSIVESLCVCNKEKDKLQNIKENLGAFLVSTYVLNVIKTVYLDIIHWNRDFYMSNIKTIQFGNDEIEKTFAFIVFSNMKDIREKLYEDTDLFPLLRHRVYTLNENLRNVKNYKKFIKKYKEKMDWHLHRIYRARNYIIHDGSRDDALNQELVINLHSYIDILINETVVLMGESPYRESMEDIILSNKLVVSIMNEDLEEKEDVEINGDNGMKFLHYNFE